MPRVLPVDAERPAAEAIREAVATLARGGLVAFPTETVYGLGALGLDARAVGAVFRAKGRPATHPLILHVPSLDAARALVARVGPLAERAAAAFWPGPLTLVLPRSPLVDDAVTGGGDTVAVRCPAHPVARALLAAVGAPLAAPSANAYQSVSPTTAAHVAASLGERVDLVLDGGATRDGLESTVLDLAGAAPRVLRPGPLGARALAEALGCDVASAGVAIADDAAVRRSPGLARRHYAPRAAVHVLARDALASAVSAARAEGRRVGVVLRAPTPAPEGVAFARVLPAEAAGYGAGLYAALHDADAAALDVLVVEALPEDATFDAARDRLARASAR